MSNPVPHGRRQPHTTHDTPRRPSAARWAATLLSTFLCTQAIAEKCPLVALAAVNKAPPPSAPTVAIDRKSCLIKATALDTGGTDIYDLRDRGRYIEFHVPGAQQATVTELVTRPGTSTRTAVVYDGGRFRSDALLLCDRLRHAGFRQLHVVDGGIAAWAQLHALPETMALSRLADTDVAAALAESGSRPVALTESLRSALPPLMVAGRPHHIERVIVLATPDTPETAIRARLKKGTTTLYWAGTPERLRQLLSTQLAQDQKRLAGPAVAKACDAL